VQVIDGVFNSNNLTKKDVKDALLSKELFWITRMKTKQPYGFNEKLPGFKEDLGVLHNMELIHKEFHKPKNKGRRNYKSNSQKCKLDCSEDVIDVLMHCESENLMSVASKTLHSCNKKTLQAVFASIDGSGLDEQTILSVKDLIKRKLFKPKKDKPPKPDKILCIFLYANRAMENIKISDAIRKSEEKWPLDVSKYKMQYHKPCVTYRYDQPIRNLVCNYNEFNRERRTIQPEKLPCRCKDFPDFVDSHHGHIVTGNTQIVRSQPLRELFKKGIKYRVMVPANANDCISSIRHGLVEYADKIKKRLRKADTVFDSWIDSVVTACQEQIRNCAIKQKFFQHEITNLLRKDLKLFKWFHVSTPVDKAPQNLGFMCKRFYYSQLHRELGIVITDQGVTCDNPVYTLANHSYEIIVSYLEIRMTMFDYDLTKEDLCLPTAHQIPKFHKKPVKFRVIIASRNCVTKALAKDVGLFLAKITCRRKNHCKAIASYCGFNPYWIIDNNNSIISCIRYCNKISYVKSVETYDFTTLYTTLDQDLIKTNLAKAIRSIMKEKRLFIGGNKSYWSDVNGFDAENIITKVNFLIDNCYFTCGDLTLKQCIGIPMGLDSAPQIANLLLHEIEYTFFMDCLKRKEYHVCRRLTNTFRYIDDVTVINGQGILDEVMSSLYPSCLKLEKINQTETKADVLDLHIWIDPRTKTFHIKTFDKRREFGFTVTSMPFLHSNVSLKMCHNVVISQIHRHTTPHSTIFSMILPAT
jgi:hypothetical protein